MADQTHRHVFEQLSRRLAEVTEALFERAPYCRGRFAGAGARLSALCRGPAKADSVLQVFEQRWPFLLAGTQRSLRDEWEIGLVRLLYEIREPCGSCNVGFGTNVFVECSVCVLKVATFSDELELFAASFGEKLAVEPPPPLPAHQAGASQGQDERVRELERECISYRETLGELHQALENTANDKAAQTLQLEELETAKKELQLVCQTFETELRESVDHIEQLADDLDLGVSAFVHFPPACQIVNSDPVQRGDGRRRSQHTRHSTVIHSPGVTGWRHRQLPRKVDLTWNERRLASSTSKSWR